MKRSLLVISFLSSSLSLFGAVDRVQFAPVVADWGLQQFVNRCAALKASPVIPEKLKQDIAEKGWQGFLDANPNIVAQAFHYLVLFDMASKSEPENEFPGVKAAEDAFDVAAADPQNVDLWKEEYALFKQAWSYFAQLQARILAKRVHGVVPAQEEAEAWYIEFGALFAASLIRMNRRHQLMGPEAYATFIEVIEAEAAAAQQS